MTPSIILDTDIDTDCDDIGALAMLHALADAGEVRILGIICDIPDPACSGCVQSVNHFHGRPQVLVGAMNPPELALPRYLLYREHRDSMMQGRAQEPYNQIVAREFPHQSGENFGAVTLYRKLLWEAADASVTIVAIGLLTALEALLLSGPDEHSDLDGRGLVRLKVKMLITMGVGSFPGGRDVFNWRMDAGAAECVLNNWPAPLAVSEWGEGVLTGASLSSRTPLSNPTRRAYEIHLGGPNRSRSSWDQVALLYGARGAGAHFTEIRGHRIRFDARSGEHRWEPDERSPHISLQQTASDEELAEVIEELMARAPAQATSENRCGGAAST